MTPAYARYPRACSARHFLSRVISPLLLSRLLTSSSHPHLASAVGLAPDGIFAHAARLSGSAGDLREASVTVCREKDANRGPGEPLFSIPLNNNLDFGDVPSYLLHNLSQIEEMLDR